MDFSQDAIDAAVSAAMRKPTFEEKLQEAAEMFLALEDGRDSAEFKRIAARVLLQSAIRSTKNKTKAATKIGVHRKSVERILHSDHI